MLSSGGKSGQFGIAFIVDARWGKHIIDWKPINERICILRLRGRFFKHFDELLNSNEHLRANRATYK